ncbi:hypothetical protein [Streptomyces sp. NBC_00582]|uniref:hypothetical protein n=1 Tax=Streptomyces sp. NBC_00582 TaxID=2975783 RepID=UPI002E80B9E8|nr:hypothetical protein [Streptomyces sp. NBC_00582]WUB67557.1 hypothetical protein OG852_47830 [Streptomyces sp. NBC_00582]
MQSSHAAAAVSVAFDDTNLVAHAGLVPVMRLAERCGLARLTAQKVKLTGARNSAGASADAKVTSIVAGMAPGAGRPDSRRLHAGHRLAKQHRNRKLSYYQLLHAFRTQYLRKRGIACTIPEKTDQHRGPGARGSARCASGRPRSPRSSHACCPL